MTDASAVDLPPEDRSHLELLMIFHYVMAAMSVMGCMAMGAYAVFMPRFIKGMTDQMAESGADVEVVQMLESMFPMFFVIFGVIAVIQLGSAALSFFCARFLKERRNRTFCQVVAALALLSIPLGTALGIFTLVVLARPTVQAAFD